LRSSGFFPFDLELLPIALRRVKLTNLLYLDHKDFIDAKLKARPAES
jgi:hypothetical protein